MAEDSLRIFSMRTFPLCIALLFLVSILTLRGVSANGGNIRLAEGKYLVNISSAPVTPVAGENVAMLISFADIKKNELLNQNIRVWLEIRLKATEEVIFPEQEYRAEGGVLEFNFVYPHAGLHELFVRFEKPDEPGKIYITEDFLVDAQPAPERKTARPGWPVIILAALAGIGIGFFVGDSGCKKILYRAKNS